VVDNEGGAAAADGEDQLREGEIRFGSLCQEGKWKGAPAFDKWRVRFREGEVGAREGRLVCAVGFSMEALVR